MRALDILLLLPSFLLFWLFFVFDVSKVELAVGLVCSALTLLALYVATRAVPLCFEPKLRWIAEARHIPMTIAQDLWVLIKALLTGRETPSFDLTPFSATAENCSASAQRTLAILFLSISPNSVVIDIDRNRNRLFYHQVARAPLADIVQKLQK